MILAIYHSSIGFIHLLSASLALIAGALVLFLPKATRLHRKIGYIYAVAMSVMLLSSFGIYHLYGSFAIFHYLAVFSSLTLVGGMVPMLLRKPDPGYVGMHFAFMYWSVVGLYMAFVAEMAVRLPDTVILDGVPTGSFYTAVAIGSGVIMVIANVFWFKYKKVWTGQFAKGNEATRESAL